VTNVEFEADAISFMLFIGIKLVDL